MKKSNVLILGFLGLGLIDTLVGYLFPIDFSFIHYSVVPHFCLIGTLIYVCDKDWLNRLLIGTLVGLGFDMLFTNTFPLDALLFGLASVVIGFLIPLMKSKKVECLIVLLVVFAYDLVPYLFERILKPEYAEFMLWFMHMEFITFGLNIFTFLFLDYIEEVMSRFFLIRKYRESKNKK